MGAFASKKPVRITVDDRPDEWIEIKKKLNAADREHVQEQALIVRGDAGSENMTVSVHMARMTMAVLRCGITNWRLLDEDGDPVKFERALIDELDLDDPLVDVALKELIEANPTLGTATASSES